MSDAVTAGLKGQKPAEGYNIQQMLEILTRAKRAGEAVQRPAPTAAALRSAAD